MSRRIVPIALAGLVLLGTSVGPALAATPSPSSTSTSTSTSASTGTATAAATGAATGAPTKAPTPTAGATPTPTASAAAPAPTPTTSPGALHPVSVGGVLFVSGVSTELHPSWDPLGGTLHVEMTVRNATDQVVDASANVGATTLLGIDLGASDSIAVRGLMPGEVRTVSTEIGGVGQWGALKVHMTMTPPSEFRGVELAPLERERWVMVPPWYLVTLALALGVVVGVFRRYRLGLVPRRRGNGRTRPMEPGSSFPVVIP